MSSEQTDSKVKDFREKIKGVDPSGTVDQVRNYVRENPGQALLISIGAGFLLGLMLRSDDDGDEG